MNNNTTINNLMPHWASSYNHFFNTETTTYASWLGYKVLAVLEFIPVIGRIIVAAEKYLYKEEKTLKPLTEKTVTPIKPAAQPKEPVDPKIADPLALYDEEKALCAQGIFYAGLSLTTGLNWKLLGFFTPNMISAWAFGSVLPVFPTTPLTALWSTGQSIQNTLGIRQGVQTKEGKEFLSTLPEFQRNILNNSALLFGYQLVSSPIAPAPLKLAAQGALSAYQIKQALTGIGTCIGQVGTGDSWTILRNLTVHSINIATAGYNFVSQATAIVPELAYYGSFALSKAVSPQYAEGIFGNQCQGYFHPALLEKVPAPIFTNYSEYFLPRISYMFDTANHYLSGFNWLTASVNSMCENVRK